MDFKALEGESYNVFKDKRVLSHSYVPSKVVCRDPEKYMLGNILASSVKNGFLPPMVRVFGKSGSGKTVVVKCVLEEYSEYKGNVFRYFFVNLKNCRTVVSAVNALLSEVCGRKVPLNLGLDRVFKELWTAVEELKEKGVLFIVFVFDEADSVFLDKHFDASDLFYRILRASNIVPSLKDVNLCVITITNDLNVLNNSLDNRVKSSMGNECVFFPGYSQESLMEILKARVDDAFKDNQVSDEVLSYCAQLAAEQGGDARKASGLLKGGGERTNAAYSKVTKESIREANERVEKDEVIEILRSLPMEAEVIVFILAVYVIEKRKTVTTREFYDFYSKLKFSGQLRKVGHRRVLDIINDLEKFGILSTHNVSKGRGGYRKEINFAVDPQNIINYYSQTAYGLNIEVGR